VSFGARLLIAIVLTLSLVGIVGYGLMARELRRSQVAAYATTQRADVRSLEAVGRHNDGTAARTATDHLIAAIAQRAA
jgi:hypothetical protein